MKNFFARIGLIFGYILGVYLIGRALVEPFIMDYGNPASYKDSWGGPTLVGVLAVHMLPGVIALVLIIWHQKSRRK
ncbi:MAG TPA: hypothetical protein VJ843_04220 [Candidatus Saccharimonadales bacterium]|nr:hypothetical protein [Candidatus Saccharimonadales bacterium]